MLWPLRMIRSLARPATRRSAGLVPVAEVAGDQRAIGEYACVVGACCDSRARRAARGPRRPRPRRWRHPRAGPVRLLAEHLEAHPGRATPTVPGRPRPPPGRWTAARRTPSSRRPGQPSSGHRLEPLLDRGRDRAAPVNPTRTSRDPHCQPVRRPPPPVRSARRPRSVTPYRSTASRSLHHRRVAQGRGSHDQQLRPGQQRGKPAEDGAAGVEERQRRARTSPEPMSPSSAPPRAATSWLRWVRVTSFGSPVVPPVWKYAATSSSLPGSPKTSRSAGW